MEELMSISDDSLARFLARWYGNPDNPGIRRFPAASGIPSTLLSWHEATSHWSTPVTVQNYAIDPDELEIEDGKIIFWVENQGCWAWATDIDSENPQVFEREMGREIEPWTPTGERLSEFLLHATVLEAIWGAQHRKVATRATIDQASRALVQFSPLPLPNWRWPSEDTRILVSRDLLALVSPSGLARPTDTEPVYDLVAAAANPHDLEALADTNDVVWTAPPTRPEVIPILPGETLPDFFN